jgi:predicted acyl esterase
MVGTSGMSAFQNIGRGIGMALIAMCSGHIVVAGDSPKVSALFQYSGYSTPEWNGFTRSAEFVTMKDGTRLAVDILLPKAYTGAGTAPKAFPVILRYTPYGRTFLKTGTEEIIVQERLRFFIPHGYAIVCADMRGTGGSDGWDSRMSRGIREDGKAIVDWIAEQSWSTGKVGMIGGSYEGWSQLAVASMRPTALKAIAPTNASWDGFIAHPGGIFSYAFQQIWSAFTYSLNHAKAFGPVPTYYPTPPMVDEDGDGQLGDEIPFDVNGNGWLHDDYQWPLKLGRTPKYADGVSRTHHYYLSALMQHHAHPGGAPGTYDGFIASMMKFRDTPRPGDGLTAPDLNWVWFPDLYKSDIAVLQIGGWFDPYIRSSFDLYTTLSQRNPARMLATPTYHQGISKAAAAALGASDAGDTKIELLRWYDHWLKGIDNGIEREPPVNLFVMNAGWRAEPKWPLPQAVATSFYFSASSSLLRKRPPAAAGADRYKADFTHYSAWSPAMQTRPIAEVNAVIGRPPPVAATFLRNRQIMYGVPEGLPVRTELDRKVLCYTSKPLGRDTDLIGYPQIHLWVSSTADDGDFYFYLEDVAPNGEAVLITEYQHRAGFSRLRDNDELIPNNPGIDVQPDLPWHGFREADYDGQVFAGGKAVEIVTALYPTAWRLLKGHSVRVSIAAADWPSFELHPKLSPQNRPDAPDNEVPTLSVHWGGKRASFVELPLVAVGRFD